MPKAWRLKESIPSMAPLESTERRIRSKLERSPLRSARRSREIPSRTMSDFPGPEGLKGECDTPRKPAWPASAQGLCPMSGASPTKAGMEGSTRPSIAERLAPMQGHPPWGGLLALRPARHWTESCPPEAPTIDRMKLNLSLIRAMRGKYSQISIPDTFVGIGLNSPRISLGASILRSNIS